MGFILSIVVFAAGAILRWAVNAKVAGIELTTIGLILMVVGVVGFVLSAIQWMTRERRTEQVVDQGNARVITRDDVPRA